MNHWLDECRWLYNYFLEEHIDTFKSYGLVFNFKAQENAIPNAKKDRPTLANVCDQVLQDVVKRVDQSFKDFFRRVEEAKEGEPEFPRFRAKNEYNSLIFPRSEFRFINCKKLRLSKIGDIKIVLRKPFEGIIKTCTIKRSHIDKWYVSFTCKCEPDPLPKIDTKIIDMTYESPIDTTGVC
jgi:putative transposase